LQEIFHQLSGYHLGGGTSNSGGDHVGRAEDLPDYVVASDGSRYPRAAAWCVDRLPARVVPGERRKTVGFIVGRDGKDVVVKSGEQPHPDPRIVKADVVGRMLLAAGFEQQNANFLSSHVEMKVAATMVKHKRWKIELVINNVPCPTKGANRLGCGDALDRYLSWENARTNEGKYSLTVHGTTAQGEPFSETYPRGEQA
jgi:hypothetical protein